jgi:hypothetical protein
MEPDVSALKNTGSSTRVDIIDCAKTFADGTRR